MRIVQSRLDFTDLDFTYNLNFTYFFLRTDFLLHMKTQFYIFFWAKIRFYVSFGVSISLSLPPPDGTFKLSVTNFQKK